MNSSFYLTDKQVEELLEGYIQVDDISKVPLGVHLHYCIDIDNQIFFGKGGFLYPNGGFLRNIDGLPDFVMLSNEPTGVPRRIPVENKIFYRKN
jgi:hypothetical protein